MVSRPNKPLNLASTPGPQRQATVDISHANSHVSAVLPSGESVEILLYGATVISWKDASGDEKLWLSDAATLDGTKAVRGGIPLVFPVFGPPPHSHATSSLPQHGLARTSVWEFLGKSTSEGNTADGEDLTVKLDFGLSSSGLDEDTRSKWGYAFNLIYSVTLGRKSLTTSLVVTNDDDNPFDMQVLMHTYLRVKDISTATITGLKGAEYVDKVNNAATKTEDSEEVEFKGEVDRVYTPAGEVAVLEKGKKVYSVVRDNLTDVVVWNPWIEKSKGMGDFEPKDGYKNMVCVEAGSVRGWQTLERGDAFEGSQVITLA